MKRFSSGVFTRKISLFILIAALLFSCKPPEEKKPPPPPDVPVVQVLKKDVPVYGEFVGQTYGYFDIAIRARVDGVLESRHFDEG